MTHAGPPTVKITLNSTLTSEDENRIAPALLTALGSMFELLPVAYRIRIDTNDAQVYQLTGPPEQRQPPVPLFDAIRMRLVPRDPIC